MVFESSTFITMIIALISGLTIFFKVKSDSEKNTLIIKKNSSNIDSLYSEINALKKDYEKEVSSRNKEVADTVVLLDTKLQNEVKNIINEISTLKSGYSETLSIKLEGMRKDNFEALDKIYSKVDDARDVGSDNASKLMSLENEIKSIATYELTHIRKDIEKLENKVTRLES